MPRPDPADLAPLANIRDGLKPASTPWTDLVLLLEGVLALLALLIITVALLMGGPN